MRPPHILLRCLELRGGLSRSDKLLLEKAGLGAAEIFGHSGDNETLSNAERKWLMQLTSDIDMAAIRNMSAEDRMQAELEAFDRLERNLTEDALQK